MFNQLLLCTKIMENAVRLYNRGKFVDCIELLKALPEVNNIGDVIQKEICLNVCLSLIALISNDERRIREISQILYLQHRNIAALQSYVDLEVASLFNYIWWELQVQPSLARNDVYLNRILETVNKCMKKILGTSMVINTHDSIEQDVLMNIKNMKDKLFVQSYKAVLLLLEVIVVTILHILKYKNSVDIMSCGETLDMILINIEILVESSNTRPLQKHDNTFGQTFIFCLDNISTTVDQLTCPAVLHHLHTIWATTLYLTKDHRKCAQILKVQQLKNETTFFRYLGAMNQFVLQQYHEALGLLLKPQEALSNSMRCRYDVLLARVYSNKGDHAQAVKLLKRAQDMDCNTPAVLYYLAMEYGKAGLNDIMLDSLKCLLRLMKSRKIKHEFLTYYDILMKLLHPEDEVSDTEALYALAMAYGLNHKYHKSADCFEDVLRGNVLSGLNEARKYRTSIVVLPTVCTALHEAAVMNLSMGNPMRAQQLCLDAMEKYCQDTETDTCEDHVYAMPDRVWIQQVLELDLGLEMSETCSKDVFYEHHLSMFDEDVIGLAILSEIRCGQDSDEYKTILGRQFAFYSKYMSTVQRKAQPSEQEKKSSALVMGLAAKCCCNVAIHQMKNKPDQDVDNMFKRALSCNNGDKDVLYNFAVFLLKRQRVQEASKLMKTFYSKPLAVSSQQCQSLALKHLLRTKVSSKQLESILREVGGL